MRCESASSRANTRANKKSKRRHLKSSSSVVIDGEGGGGGWGAEVGEGSAEDGGCAAMGHKVVEVYNVVRCLHVCVLYVPKRVVRCLHVCVLYVPREPMRVVRRLMYLC